MNQEEHVAALSQAMEGELGKILALLLYRFSPNEMVVLTAKDWDHFMQNEVNKPGGKGHLVLHGDASGNLMIRLADCEAAQAVTEFAEGKVGHA